MKPAVSKSTPHTAEHVRAFILDHVQTHPGNLAALIVDRFAISRQAANKYLRQLVAEGILIASGQTRDRSYSLAATRPWRRSYPLDGSLEEDVLWRRDIAPALGDLPRHLLDIWAFCVTEMLNNAMDHSGGTSVRVTVLKTSANSAILIQDDGVGIFHKLQTELHLLDERHAVLELSKGKLTTDPQRHTGQGIFFSSRMVDRFEILSRGIHFIHTNTAPADVVQPESKRTNGTTIILTLSHTATQTVRGICEQYASDSEDLAFNKTIFPVTLAQYGQEQLVSRSQAKRLLARVDQFRIVVLDFEGLDFIGPAFADEIFRVFARNHPEVEIVAMRTSPSVQAAIDAAQNNS